HGPRDEALREQRVHDLVVLRRVARPVHVRAARGGGGFELREVPREVVERVRLDRGRAIAQRLPFGQCARGAVALLAHEPERLVVPARARLAGGEARGRVGMAVPSPASARISATCATRTGTPVRRATPSRCARQETSVAVMYSAPASTYARTRSRPIIPDTADSATANVPPKPQHSSRRAGSTSAMPSSEPSSARAGSR